MKKFAQVISIVFVAFVCTIAFANNAYAAEISKGAAGFVNEIDAYANKMAEDIKIEQQFCIDRIADQRADAEKCMQINEEGAEYEVKHNEAKAKNGGMPKSSLLINGEVISFVQCDHELDYAMDVASTYVIGDGNVSDNAPTYFVGHNPGVFTPVMDLSEGDNVTVCDYNGNTRTYTVQEILTVNYGDTSKQVSDGICYSGEAISLQTCNGDGSTMRIVKCK